MFVSLSWKQDRNSLIIKHVPTSSLHNVNKFYINNKAPLLPQHFIKLPVGSIEPHGWLKKMLELQRAGLTGHLDEISIWLGKKDNAWLNKNGEGKYGWEELPYWLKGFGEIAYTLKDSAMINKVKFWIDAVLSSQRTDGDFGPKRMINGNRDLWANMPMLWCLQSWYEYSNDPRVIFFMSKYFKYEMSVSDNKFLKDYWENSRGGDNLISVYWLYNRTGDSQLLELAKKIHRNTANWKQENNLPDWHNVNIAEGFREPAEFYFQTKDSSDLNASYNDFHLVRNMYGQVPGGMFGADENARKGYVDPRQAVETCGMVEQMTSDQMLLNITGDGMWADNCEDVAFNMFPAAFMPDYRSLRYLTAPNMVLSDNKNHHPGIDNSGPFLMMNPFSSRCCQHNHSAGWVYFIENSWSATNDNGLAVQLYSDNTVHALVGNGTKVEISESTNYPFDDKIIFTIHAGHSASFPLYLRIPDWCDKANVVINGRSNNNLSVNKGYLKLYKQWNDGDKIELQLPMKLFVRTWNKNKNSISINYGPLTFSLKIKENYIKKDSRITAMEDSKWQDNADPGQWPAYQIEPASDWNYGLSINENNLEKSIKIIHKIWPKDNNPFTVENVPIELSVRGKQIPQWKIDKYGLCDTLPQSPVSINAASQNLILVPMGAARLRISAFPVTD
ncbi:MAG: glycoside hydrolase family 127 protein [Arachidicoccus sp.]|nr:glycoside hydrolase family 127 protein [Arachidicoccus sp.]